MSIGTRVDITKNCGVCSSGTRTAFFLWTFLSRPDIVATIALLDVRSVTLAVDLRVPRECDI